MRCVLAAVERCVCCERLMKVCRLALLVVELIVSLEVLLLEGGDFSKRSFCSPFVFVRDCSSLREQVFFGVFSRRQRLVREEEIRNFFYLFFCILSEVRRENCVCVDRSSSFYTCAVKKSSPLQSTLLLLLLLLPWLLLLWRFALATVSSSVELRSSSSSDSAAAVFSSCCFFWISSREHYGEV